MNPGDEHDSPAEDHPRSNAARSPGESSPAPSDSLFDRRRPLATYLLLLTNLAWFAAGLVIARRIGAPLAAYLGFGHPLAMATILDRLGAVSAASLLHGDWWRLVACCFVHVGFWHLLMNMVGLVVAGPLAEYLWGRKRVPVIYLLAGLGGSCLAMAHRPLDPQSGMPVLLAGASGALWGIMASLAAWLLLFRRRMHRKDVIGFGWRLSLAFVLNIGVSLLPGVSWEAHAGGGVAGFMAAAAQHVLRFGRRPWRILAGLALVVMPALCLGGLVWAMRSGDAWAPLRTRMLVKESAVFVYRPPPGVLVRDAAGGAAVGIEEAARAWVESQDLARLLTALSPQSSRPLEAEALLLLSREPEKRPPKDVEELRSKVAAQRSAADEVVRRMAEPTGNAEIDAGRARVKSAAESRGRAIDVLLGLLDSKQPPTAEQWAGWAKARREAESRWAELNEPAP
jgi:membrane associated rhomboid family serine protease